jgi:5'-3' exonuclease
VDVHVVDGTYELFRYYYSPGGGHTNSAGREVDATRRVVGSMLSLLEGGATHLGIATDHVIESFRNDLYPGYKTGEGVEPELRAQFPLLEDALRAAGIVVWPMVEFEADDAMGAAAVMAARDERVEKVFICTPDKDLAQCVTDDGRIVQWDRRRDIVYDAAGVIEKFGVRPASIPDYLALVGDSADGFPGLKGWGAKSAGKVLFAYGHLEDVPQDITEWNLNVRGAAKLVATLFEQFEDALLFRRIATLELDAPTSDTVDQLEWVEPTSDFSAVCDEIDGSGLVDRAARLAQARAEGV